MTTNVRPRHTAIVRTRRTPRYLGARVCPFPIAGTTLFAALPEPDRVDKPAAIQRCAALNKCD